KVWDLGSDRPAFSWSAELAHHGATAFGRGGRLFAVGDCFSIPDQAEVRVLDAATGRERTLRSSLPGNRFVTALAFSPADRFLAVARGGTWSGAHANPTVELWEVATASRPAVLELSADGRFSIEALAFAPDGRTLAVAGNFPQVYLFDTAATKERRPLPGFDKGGARRLPFSPGGNTLAVAQTPPTEELACITLWDVATGKKRGPARAVGSGILALAFSPDGRRLAAGCLDRGLYLLDEEFVPKFESLTGHAPREAWAVAFFPGGKTL